MEEIEEVEQNNRTTSVRVFLPKFTCKKTLRLNGPLKKIGMDDMFSRRANFPMLADKSKTMRLSQVKKCNISLFIFKLILF
jgi:serine protease inhibitor